MIRRLEKHEFAGFVHALRGQSPDFIFFNTEHFINYWSRFFDTGVDIVLGSFVEDVPAGILCGLLVPDVFTGQLQALENLWFVLPQFRKSQEGLRLLKTFEEIAVSRGAQEVICGRWAKLSPTALAEVYRKRGYEPFAVAYRKLL